jgi:hypothetical protein
MINPSSSLSRKYSLRRLLFFFRFCVAVFLLILAVNLGLSVAINHRFQAWQKRSVDASALSFRARFCYFNLLRGLTIFDATLLREGEPYFQARRLELGFDGFSIFSKKIRIKKVVCEKARVSVARIASVVPGLLEIIRSMDKTVQIYDTTNWRLEDIVVDEGLSLDASGYFSMIQDRLFIARGKLHLRKIRIGSLALPILSRQGPFLEPFDVIVEVERQEGAYVITRMEASNAYLKLTGSGDVAATDQGVSRVNVRLDTGVIGLEDISVADATSTIGARGSVRLVAKVFGPLEDLRSGVEAQIDKVSFSLGRAMNFHDMTGRLVLTQGYLIGHGMALTVNQWPLSVDFSVSMKEKPSFLVQLASRDKVDRSPAFLLSASGVLSPEGRLDGRLNGRWCYPGKETTSVWTFRGSRVQFEPRTATVLSDELAVRLAVGHREEASSKEIFAGGLSIKDLYGVFAERDEGLWLKPVRGTTCGGSVEGEAFFFEDKMSPQARGEAHIRGIDLHLLNIVSLAQGRVDADLRFDTTSSDMIKGQVFVTNGMITENTILNAVADFLGIKALHQVSFGDLSIFLNGGHGDFTSQVKMKSSLVNGFLDAKIISYDKIDGFLSLDLATELLNESKMFRKILIYLKHDKPSVVFPFKISSYISSPRVLWLKNEFKEDLQGLLPERNKRALQAEVSRTVEAMKAE